MQIGTKQFQFDGHHVYVMGILNVTPDSFSDGGKFNTLDAALKHTEEMIRDGADVIDIGGESTRPGHVVISEEEEIARVTPVIEAVKKHFDIPVSIDTYKGKVTLAALQAGADLVNDIWGPLLSWGCAAALCITGMKPYMMIFKKILSGICRSALQLQRKPMYPMIRLCWTPAWDLAKRMK